MAVTKMKRGLLGEKRPLAKADVKSVVEALAARQERPLMFARCVYGHRRVISARGMRKVVARAIDGQPRAKSAEQLGIHAQYLYAILNGKKGVGDELALKLGFQRVTMFRPIKPEPKKP